MDRRTLLKAGINLPLFSGLVGIADFDKRVRTDKNLMILCMDFGFLRQDLFYGANQDCDSEYFQMLDPIKGKYTFFYGTHQPNLLGSSHGAHPAGLSLVKQSQKSIYALESLDQYVGAQSVRECRHRTIGFATSKTGRVNWNSSAQKVPAISSVTEFHRALFGEVDVKAELAAANEQLRILTRVHNDVMRRAASEQDRRLADSLKVKMDVLKEDVYWIERGTPKVDVEIDPKAGAGDQHVQLGTALRLCTEAFKHKLSKVATVYFDGSGHVALKGVTSGYHGLSHKPRNDDALKQKRIVDQFVFETVVEHVQDLEKRGMLDDTVVLLTSVMGNAASHSNSMLPVFLMGGGLKHQGVFRCLDDKKTLTTSLADVYQTIIAELGVPPMELPYCKGPVREVLS